MFAFGLANVSKHLRGVFSSSKPWHASYKRVSPSSKITFEDWMKSSLWVHFESLKSYLFLSWFLSWEAFSSSESSCTYPLGFITKVACFFSFLSLNPFSNFFCKMFLFYMFFIGLVRYKFESRSYHPPKLHVTPK